MRSTRSAMLAASLLAMMGGLGAAAQSMPTPRKGSSRNYADADIERSFARYAPPKPGPEELRRQALNREISEHNEAVERRKAEKKARKLAR
jgi:hypothetical protein